MDDAARDRPVRVGVVLAASRHRPIPLAGHPRAHAGDPGLAAHGRGAAHRGGLRLLDACTMPWACVRRRARALSAARPDLIHGLRDRAQRRPEYPERRRRSAIRAYSVLGLAAKQIATVIAFGTLTFCLGAAALLGLSLLVGGRGCPPRCCICIARSSCSPAACCSRASLAYLMLRVQPARAAALAQDRDPGSETAHRLRPSRRCLRGSAVRRRGAVRAAAAAGRDRLRGLRGRVHHRHRRGHHQQRAGRRRRVRVGAAAAVPLGAGRSTARARCSPTASFIISCPLPWRCACSARMSSGCTADPWCGIGQLGRTWLSAVTPQASALAVFGAGAVLLFSGATPGFGNRLEMLRHFVPLPVLELSHLLGSAVGVGLLVLAQRPVPPARCRVVFDDVAAVRRRVAVASQGIRLRGGDHPRRGRGDAGLGRGALSPARLADRAALLGSRGWSRCCWCSGPPPGWSCSRIGTCRTARSCGGSSPFEAPAPRSLRALLLAAMIAAAYALWRLLRPSKPSISPPSAADLERAAALIENAHDATANLALARRQESAVQRGSHGLHHVSGLGQQLGVHGRSGRAARAVRAAGVDLHRELRRDGGVAGVLPGHARKPAAVHRPGIDA